MANWTMAPTTKATTTDKQDAEDDGQRLGGVDVVDDIAEGLSRPG